MRSTEREITDAGQNRDSEKRKRITADSTAAQNTIAMRVKGPVPRKAPYVKFRYRLYVPSDVRDWRMRIARLFLKAGGRLPKKGERVWVSYHYGFVKSHADHDSITHSAQDALSKDALHCSDKEWFIGSITSVRVAAKRDEFIEITVEYRQEDNGK